MMIYNRCWPTAIPPSILYLAILFLSLVGCSGRYTPRGIEAITQQEVYPVLIRNDENALIQLVIDVKRKENVLLTSVEFSLEGTDQQSDFESFALFYSGKELQFSPDQTFSTLEQTATKLSFQGNQTLDPGLNVFWLSGRLKSTADLSHKVTVACTLIETSAGSLNPKNHSPLLHRRIGIALRKHNDEGVNTHRIPALTTTPKGTLLCVYDMRRRKSRDLQEDIDIGLSRSTDGGRTWITPQVIMDMGEYGGLPQEQNGCSDPGIIVDTTTGEIFCFAVWMWGKPGKHQWGEDGSEPGYQIGKSAQFMMVRSQDDGKTWTKPENLTRKLKKKSWWLFAPSPQTGINLVDGTLVMPAQGRDEKGVPFSSLLVSRDHGASWTVSSPAFSGVNECQAVVLGDGSIMLNMRNNHERYRAVYVTKNLGETWRPHPTNRNTLIEPHCNGSLIRFDYQQAGDNKHLLLFSNPRSQKARTHQTIQVSLNDGLTWPSKYHLLLDEGQGRGYPSMTRIDDQHIGIVYEGSQSNLVFEKISLDELLNR